MTKNTFLCPVTREEFQETDEPLLDRDPVSCPCCGEEHVVESGFRGSLLNRYACRRARKRGFIYVRSDRKAIEFAAGPDTPRNEWHDGDGRRVLAYTVGDVIFWPSRKAMCRLADLAHELCHVRQARRSGVLFSIKYWCESVIRGYDNNKYERGARRAEGRARRRRAARQ
jgi:hypothetical protein